MMSSTCFALCIALSATLASTVLGQEASPAQEAPPKEAFKTVHLVTLSDADVVTVQTALDDLNAIVAKAGYPAVRYRLYKVVGRQTGSYSHLWESSWPGGEVYDTVHKSAEWQAALKKHAGIAAVMKGEVYNRYVEVPSAGPSRPFNLR